MQWNHYTLPLAPAVRATLRDSTEQCASVTTAFLQARAPHPARCKSSGNSSFPKWRQSCRDAPRGPGRPPGAAPCGTAARAPAPGVCASVAPLPPQRSASPSLASPSGARPDARARPRQVIAALCDAEGGRPGGGRNILALLAANTRRTKVVSLATGTHRVPDELRRHTLTDADGVQYSTNLDRNRYGADTQYLNTVLRHDLAALGLCPHLLTVVIHDAKKRGALALPADAPCCCAAAAARGPLPPPASLFGNAVAPGSAPAQHAMPPPPPSGGSAPRGAVTMGGIGLLLDALAACGYKPPPSPFASGKMGAAQQATATAYAAAAFAGVNAAAAVVHGASAGGARPQRPVVPFGAASPGAAAAAQALAAAQAVAPAGAPRRRLLPLMSPGSVPPAEASAAAEASEESLDASGSAGGAGDENMAADDDVAAAARDAEAAAPHADDPQAVVMSFDAACAAPLRRRRTAPGAEAALAAAEARAAAAEDAAKALAAELAQMRAALAVRNAQERNAPLPMLPPPPPSASPAPAAAAAPASVLGKQAREGGGAFANVPKRPRGLTGRLGASPPTPAAGAASAAALRAAALQSPPVALKSEEATAVAAATAQ
jgi:hypothetical protein